MATGGTYSDREFLFRLQTLVIDGGTEVLRNIFDQSLKNQPLNVFLANEKTNIMSLRAKKIITSAQFDLLYPKGGLPANNKEFDITLFVCLLRNLPNLGLNQNYKWNIQPQPLDQTIEANLHRLKCFRNDIAHTSSTTGFTHSSFQTQWNEIEQVLLRLNSAMPRPLANFSQNIDSYKHSPIDPAAEQKLQTTIDQWREMEKGQEKEIKQIKLDVSGAMRKMENTDQRVEEIEKDVKEIKELQGPGRHGKSRKFGRISKFFGIREKKLRKDLQDDLILFYKDQHKSIQLSPLMEEDQPLLKFYEMPDIQSVKVTRSREGHKPEKTPVKTLRDVFYKEDKLCSNIYLTADAGYGKTAFSKKLALAWCHAKKPDKSEEKHFSKHEIKVMRGFSFVFVVLLRESSSECDVDKLILNQICSQLAHKHRYNEENVANILCKKKCLVILDGLDEWTHPVNSCRQGESDIPHKAVRENVAVLTTTRPWKLSVCGLHSSQIDQKLELRGLSDDSAKKLKRSVISHLHGELDESKIDKYETEFNMTVQENQKSDLTAIPLFLMYFLFLWFHKMNVGKSLADLFSSFIEFLLSRTVKKETRTETAHGNIPPCFNTNTLCKQCYTLLTALGKLAFYTLFSETKENTLVFDGCIAEEYLSKDELTFCLKTGIITQSKVQGALVQQITKVTFAHKTMQEFLAALYIHSATDQKSIQEILLSKCKCVKDILDMSKIFMFIVSISGTFSFSSDLMKIINEDEITQEYRRSLQGRYSGDVYHPLKDLQDMYISCSKEIPRANEVRLCLQDVIIDDRCRQQEYGENLKRLTTRNKEDIRSVCINMLYMEDTLFDTGRKVIDYFALSELKNIEKIYYLSAWDEDIDDVILPLLNSSVTSLYLSCSILQRGSWSRCLFDKVTSLQKLEAIGIRGFEMSHSELSLLLDFISQRDCLREIKLEWLYCNDDKWPSCTGHSLLLGHKLLRKLTLNRPPCTGLSLLCGHKSLRKLTLCGLDLSQVIINMASLENCVLQYLSNEDFVLKFVNCADNKLNTFECRDIESSAAIDEIGRMLRKSQHVREVELIEINLGSRNLTLSSDFVNIEHFELRFVSMEASACKELVGSVFKLKQTVTVDIDDCTISTEEEFETLKREIKTLQRVRILEDEKDSFSFRFKFETNKDGDLKHNTTLE